MRICFDNAATAGRRPPEVGREMLRALNEVSGNPGRSGHPLSLEAARIVEGTRSAVAERFGVPDPACVLFTRNATEALNLALLGRLDRGSRVLHSAWEHNSVMRPLRWLESSRGVAVEEIPAGEDGPVDLEWLRNELEGAPVDLVAVQAASNVTGEVMPVAQIGRICRRSHVRFLVDAAQGAGIVPLHLERDRIDALALTGHKSLLGPPGTGALCVRTVEGMEPLLRGGTGSRSEEEEQPPFAPDRFEAGTANVPGLAGLGAALRALSARGTEAAREEQRDLLERLLDTLSAVPGVRLLGPGDPDRQLATVSFTVEGMPADQVARRLGERGLLCRPGLHCAPRAHRSLGTFPGGAVRFSLSGYNTVSEIEAAGELLAAIVRDG
jgi:cysteine desulfurase family protein